MTELLADHHNRTRLPCVMWLDSILKTSATGGIPGMHRHLAPNINALPFVDRTYLCQDPYLEVGRREASMVGTRGRPCNCSFCGARVSTNPDNTIRVRDPHNIIA
ncbi:MULTISPECIES: hypothetical protein [Nocardia]|uniref:hypothetical protein n=1 Tax=Nocardia TaxID=1817 RepID=UPI000A59608E|nr:hypothetical protein [Nocardia africana]MCC3317898.1 hypothetical protein [Nocardia africana]